MELDNHIYPFIYYKGKARILTRCEEFASSYFGGPGDIKIKGLPHGPKKLHHIATIVNSDTGLDTFDFGVSLPFYYGMSFDGCKLEYQCSYRGYIDITQIEPENSCDDWPYENYPIHLPYFPLCVEKAIDITPEEANYQLSGTLHGYEILDEELVLIVPPNPRLGMSLWGPHGDAEGIELVFIFNTKTGAMKVQNSCS